MSTFELLHLNSDILNLDILKFGNLNYDIFNFDILTVGNLRIDKTTRFSKGDHRLGFETEEAMKRK
jgi:hypothetical protein